MPYLCTFAARKNHFAAVFFIMYVCEYLIYRKTPKSVLFAVCSRFRVLYVVRVLYFVFGTFVSVFFCFRFHSLFCFTKIMCETLCKFLYVYARLICMFMHNIMINRKLFGNFGFFGILAKNVLSFYFLFLVFFPSVLMFQN